MLLHKKKTWLSQHWLFKFAVKIREIWIQSHLCDHFAASTNISFQLQAHICFEILYCPNVFQVSTSLSTLLSLSVRAGLQSKKHKSFWRISGSVESRETTSNGDTRGLYQALAASWCTMCLYLIKKCALVQNSKCKNLAWEMSYWMSSSFQ